MVLGAVDGFSQTKPSSLRAYQTRLRAMPKYLNTPNDTLLPHRIVVYRAVSVPYPADGVFEYKPQKVSKRIVYKPDYRKVNHQAGVFYYLITLLGLYALFTNQNKEQASNLLLAIVSPNVATRIYKNTYRFSIENFFYTFLFVVTLAVFADKLLRYFEYQMVFQNQMFGFKEIVLLLAGLYVVYYVCYLALGLALKIDEQVKYYLYNLLLINQLMGFLLTIALLFNFFGTPPVAQFGLYASMALIGAYFLIRAYKILEIGNKLFVYKKFHFVLYFCATEIIPILLIAKILLKNA